MLKIDDLPDIALELRQQLSISSNSLHSQNLPSPTEHLTCTVQQPPQTGAFNAVYRLEFSDGISWALKIPRAGHAEKWNSQEANFLKRCAHTMQLVERETSIPVPHVFDFDTSLHNRVGCPYTFMSYLEGIPAVDVWCNNDVSHERLHQNRVRMLVDLAKALLQLNEIKLPGIGAPEFDDDGRLTGVSSWTQRDYELGGSWCYASEPREIGPFSNLKPLLHVMCQNMKVEDNDDEDNLAWLNQILEWVVEFCPPTDARLIHDDLNLYNFVADTDGRLKGILDWDFVLAVPECLGNKGYPKFLAFDFKTTCDGTDECELGNVADEGSEIEGIGQKLSLRTHHEGPDYYRAVWRRCIRELSRNKSSDDCMGKLADSIVATEPDFYNIGLTEEMCLGVNAIKAIADCRADVWTGVNHILAKISMLERTRPWLLSGSPSSWRTLPKDFGIGEGPIADADDDEDETPMKALTAVNRVVQASSIHSQDHSIGSTESDKGTQDLSAVIDPNSTNTYEALHDESVGTTDDLRQQDSRVGNGNICESHPNSHDVSDELLYEYSDDDSVEDDASSIFSESDNSSSPDTSLSLVERDCFPATFQLSHFNKVKPHVLEKIKQWFFYLLYVPGAHDEQKYPIILPAEPGVFKEMYGSPDEQTLKRKEEEDEPKVEDIVAKKQKLEPQAEALQDAEAVFDLKPTDQPSEEPTGEPAEEPTEMPTEEPTEEPAEDVTTEEAAANTKHRELEQLRIRLDQRAQELDSKASHLREKQSILNDRQTDTNAQETAVSAQGKSFEQNAKTLREESKALDEREKAADEKEKALDEREKAINEKKKALDEYSQKLAMQRQQALEEFDEIRQELQQTEQHYRKGSAETERGLHSLRQDIQALRQDARDEFQHQEEEQKREFAKEKTEFENEKTEFEKEKKDFETRQQNLKKTKNVALASRSLYSSVIAMMGRMFRKG